MNKKYVTITIGIMCFLLTLGIVVQLNTIKEANKALGTSSNAENGLRDEVLKWKEKYDSTYSSLLREQKELENKRAEATKNDSNSAKLEEELKTANKLLGLTDVTGSGVIITIADNQSTTSQTLGVIDANYLLVHSSDIIQIINELKNAGAEAISVNDERIVLTTSITCDGNVVLVNGEKIGSPFVIKAIGNPELLSNLTRPGGFLEIMKQDGIQVELKKSDKVSIAKYNGVLTSKYLTNALRKE